MNLPYADDIRRLRAELEASTHAKIHAQTLGAARMALSILEMQHRGGMPIPPELPGEELIETTSRAYPTLAELPSLMPASGSTATRIHARSQQLDLIDQTFQPLLARYEEVAAEMHDLQHKQHHALHHGEWAEAVATLSAIGTQRDELAKALIPMNQQVGTVQPVRDMLLGFHPHLQDELVSAARTPDPDGVVAWRAATLARQQLIGLAQVIEQLGMVVQYPFEPMLPDRPHPRHRIRLRKEAGGVLEWMVRLSDLLTRHGDELETRRDELQRQHDALETQIKDWMG